MKLRGLFFAATVLLMPAAALAAPGVVTTNVSLRAGPGEGFPTVDREQVVQFLQQAEQQMEKIAV